MHAACPLIAHQRADVVCWSGRCRWCSGKPVRVEVEAVHIGRALELRWRRPAAPITSCACRYFSTEQGRPPWRAALRSGCRLCQPFCRCWRRWWQGLALQTGARASGFGPLPGSWRRSWLAPVSPLGSPGRGSSWAAHRCFSWCVLHQEWPLPTFGSQARRWRSAACALSPAGQVAADRGRNARSRARTPLPRGQPSRRSAQMRNRGGRNDSLTGAELYTPLAMAFHHVRQTQAAARPTARIRPGSAGCWPGSARTSCRRHDWYRSAAEWSGMLDGVACS